MSLDVLALGPFVFTEFAVPELLPAGGRQQMRLHKMPGGNRRVDAMGPDDADRVFEVLHVGVGALAAAQTLDQMRISGRAWPYSNGVEARTVIIQAAEYRLEKFNVIHQALVLTPIDNPAGASAMPASTDMLIQADLGAASATAATSTADATPVTTPQQNSNGIGSA